MSTEENKELVQNYFEEIWNKGNLEKESQFVDQNIVVHAAPFPGLQWELLAATPTHRSHQAWSVKKQYQNG